MTSAVMDEPFPQAEPKILQGSSKVDKKEIIKGGSSPHKEESMKYPVNQWKDYSTLQVFKPESKPESKVDLSGRGLRTLRKQHIRNLHQVVELDLSNNPLSPFALDDLSLPRLKKLNVSGCGLIKPPCYFYECNQLEELNLSNNPLDVASGYFWYPISHPVPHLKKLDLSGCGLIGPLCDFFECDQLEELNLSNNPLDLASGYLSYPVLRDLPHLKKLDLSGCGLTELPHALQGCWRLQELNLSNNFMEHSDLLEKLKSENQASVPSWYKSGMELFVEPVSVFSTLQLPNLIKVVFEDAVYTKHEGAWTVVWSEDASSTSDWESCTKLVESQSKEHLTSAVMVEPFPLAESKIPQGSSKVDKKEIMKGGFIPHKEESMKCPIKPWKDYSTLQDFKHESKPESKIDLSGRGLRTLRKQRIRNLHQVVELDLSNNPLSPFALNGLPLPRLKKLDLSGCGLTKFPCNYYVFDCNQLEELNLSNNPLGFELAFLSYPKWCHLPHLKKLDLSGCGLSELPYALQRCWSLQELNLSNNFIKHLDLSKLPNLKKVVFEYAVYIKHEGAWTVERREDASSTSNSESSTKLVESQSKEHLTSTVMGDPFRHAESRIPQGSSKVGKKEIIKGGFSPHKKESMKNPITQWEDYRTVQDFEYESKPELKLDLSGRGLTTLCETDLRNLLQAVEVNLSYNPLHPSTLRYLHLPSVKKLDLSGCGLTEFLYKLYTYNQLEELNLSNNPLYSKLRFFYYPRLRRLPHLKKLDLSGCGLTGPSYNFSGCNQLEELNLSNNCLNSELGFSWISVLCDLSRLKKLNLSGCGLTELPYALQRCWSLQELNLSNNFMKRSDALKKLKIETKASVPSEPSWYESGMKLLLRLVSVFSTPQLPNLIKVVFEDAVYTKHEGAWTVERREDASSTSNSESSTKLVESQSKEIFDPSTEARRSFNYPYEEYDSDEDYYGHYHRIQNKPHDKIYREFYQLKKIKKKLTIENYYSMLFSLKIAVCVLERHNAEYYFNLKLTCRRCLKIAFNELLKIEAKLYRPSLKMPPLVLGSITGLKNGVLLLFKWLLGQTNLEESHQRQNIRRAFKTAFENASEAFFSESLSTGDRVLFSKLRILSKLLESFSKPDAAALGCLQLLQELHDMRDIQEMFSVPEYRVEKILLHKINIILFEFVRVSLKPSPTAEDWPATLHLGGKIHNPLTDNGLSDVSFRQELDILQSIISRQGSQDRFENDVKDSVPVVGLLSCRPISNASITVDEQGGCCSVPVASAFLVFPPDAVQGKVTLTPSRVKYKECDVKPKDGEAFVSRIFKMEPEGMVFRKPVTVLLSHSAYEDQDFLDFYELIVENLNPIDRQELNTESISCMEDVPKEIHNREMLSDYLPFAKATIYETCTLVATTRIRAHQILVPTNKSLVFSKKYGENKKVKITFPAGVTKKILCLTVQLFPADDVLGSDVCLDDNLVCAPVIKVSGQTGPFIKPVDVELTYSHNDVANIQDDFLPVGEKIPFTTDYGLLLRNQKETESKSKWLKLNESAEVYIERLRKDQIKFTFSVKHFCKLPPVVKKRADAQLNVDESSNCVSQSRYSAMVLAVHETGRIPKRIHAVLAPVTAKHDIKDKWKVDGTHFGSRLKCEEPVFFCVPLTDNQDDYHLPLKDYTLWFDPDMESELANNLKDSVDLRGRFMHFLKDRSCNNGDNHSTQGDCRAKAPIHTSNTNSVQATADRLDELSLDNESQQALENLSDSGSAQNNKNQRNKVITDVVKRCETFEKAIEAEAQEKLKINRAFVEDPKGGKLSKTINIIGPMMTVVAGLACGITIVMGFATFGIGSFVGAAVAGATLIVINADKCSKQSHAREVVEIEEAQVRSCLNCIVKEVAKELSYIFEYQLLQLKDERQVEVLANCAVNLMLNLKEGDKFDRNTLLRKVLRDGQIDRKDLLTRNEGDKWSAPNVFRKPGLRRLIKRKGDLEFMYLVNPKQDCKPQKYGYRGQFLKMIWCGDQRKQVTTEGATALADVETSKSKTSCEECSHRYDDCCSRKYFVESDIDLEYDKLRQEHSTYHPVHVLVQCLEILHCFIKNLQKERSLANFLNIMFDLPKDHIVFPVYRPHSPGRIPHLTGADLTGADFSHSDFANLSLEDCNFTKCVMLFAELAKATMSRSTFNSTLVSHSNLKEAKITDCKVIKTAVLYSCLDKADLRGMENFGDICWDGSNVEKAIIEETETTNKNEANHLMTIPRNPELRQRNPGQTQRNPRQAQTSLSSYV